MGKGRPQKPIDETTYAGQVGAIIREKRERRKLTVPEAALRAGVPVPTWYHWETGRHLPLDALPRIATALGCTVRSLIPGWVRTLFLASMYRLLPRIL